MKKKLFKYFFVTAKYIKFGKHSKIDNRQGVYGGNTPHADRETSGATETKYRYWNFYNAMTGGEKIE